MPAFVPIPRLSLSPVELPTVRVAFPPLLAGVYDFHVGVNALPLGADRIAGAAAAVAAAAIGAALDAAAGAQHAHRTHARLPAPARAVRGASAAVLTACRIAGAVAASRGQHASRTLACIARRAKAAGSPAAVVAALGSLAIRFTILGGRVPDGQIVLPREDPTLTV